MNKDNKMSDRESAVLNYLIKNCDDVLSIPIDNICKDLKVGYATIYSLIKKMGFKGYRELVMNIYHNEAQKKASDDLTLQYSYNSLMNLNFEKFDEIKMKRIILTIKSKKNIYVFGKSNSNILAQKYAFDLNRLGVRAYALANDYDQMIMEASHLDGTDDMLIIISNSGTTDYVSDLIETVNLNKIFIVVICANENQFLEKNCSIFYRIYNRHFINVKHRVSNYLSYLIFLDQLWECFDKE